MIQRLQTPLILSLLALAAHGQSYTETFDGGTNAGGWTFGNGFETIEATGGNPGEYLHNWNIDVFAPNPRTTILPCPFTGDWRARGVTGFSVDLRTFATNFPFKREATLMLTDGAGCSIYLLGTEFVPQVAEGWKSFEYSFDANSPTMPPEWEPYGSCTDRDVAWNTVIQDVQTASIFYGDPTFFFIFDTWDVGLDNAAIHEGVGSNYCTSTPNSTGVAATISATGSSSVSANDLVLVASDLPASQPGIFYYGEQQAQVPFGNGFRCVVGGAGGIGRLSVEVSSGSGVLTHDLDVTDPPSPGTQITAGSTWNFQAWFRDPDAGGANFDLSDGLEVVFQP